MHAHNTHSEQTQTQLLQPSELALGCLCTIQALKPSAGNCDTNPPGAGLATRRRIVQVS